MLPPNSLTLLKSDGACHRLENSLLKMGAPKVPTSFVQMVCIYSLEAPPSQRRSSILQVVFLQGSGIFPLRCLLYTLVWHALLLGGFTLCICHKNCFQKKQGAWQDKKQYKKGIL